MLNQSPQTAKLIAILILIAGIVHLVVSAIIIGKYRHYRDIFRQLTGLSALNIVIGIFGIATGILGLLVTLGGRISLTKTTAIMSLVLGVLTIGSLIAALVINSQAITYIRDHLARNINSYIQDERSIDVTDRVQRRYQCCGVNIWLDWARIPLGLTNGRSVTEELHHNSSQVKETRAACYRQKRQTLPYPSTIYNLPSTYTFNLPLSCCKNGGVSSGNTIGGYCVFNANNNTVGFYLSGCLPPVADVAVSHITGIVFINTVLLILAFVFVPILNKLLPATTNVNNPNNTQPTSNPVYPENNYYSQADPQYANGVYYANVANPNFDSNYGVPAYTVYR